LAVNRDGSTVDAVLSSTGQTSIRDFYAAPNNKFYVVFTSARSLYNGGPNCILAEVDADSGNPVCVDSQITSVTTSYGLYGASSANGAIQFDRQGNIYYVGTVASSGQPGPIMATLRKSVNGVVTSLVSDNVQIRDFVVLDDGNVLMSGSTTSTQTSWVRRVSPDGSLSNVSASTSSMFLRKFADGNVYMGFQGPSMSGVRRYLSSSQAMDPKSWIAGYDNNDSYFSTRALCSDRTTANANVGLCTSGGGAVISAAFNVGNSSTVVVAGWRGSGGTTLVEYFPTVTPLSVSVRNVTLASMVGNKLIIAGTTEAGVNTLSVLDLTTYQETVLIDSSNEVEVYNMSYIAATNKVMFNGLKFSNNSFVVGEFDLP
jgi:hypothetical protein